MACSTFELAPVSPFRLELTVWTLRRRPHNVIDRWDGTTYRRVLSLPDGPAEVSVAQSHASESGRLQVNVAGQPVDASGRAAVTMTLERLLGVHLDMAAFNQFAARDPRLKPLAHRFRGMKPPRFATIFESAINAIACQQMSLTLGIHLLNRLAVAHGAAMGEAGRAVHAFPRPIDLVGLAPAELRQLGFSLQKGRAIIQLAQSITDGHLDLDS